MTNREVKEFLEKNANETVYIADKLTRDGYGQTKGGYHDVARQHNIVNPTQKWHFTVAYYENKKNVEGSPTYSSLYCPELLIWIAEVAGLNEDILIEARDFIIDFEETNHLKGTEKGANYLGSVGIKFKELLHIYEINNIIKDAIDWNEVIAKVSQIKKKT